MHIAKRFGSFFSVGSLGFVVDASTLHLLTIWINLDSYSARLISFSIAVTTTWALNRLLTFRDRRTSNLLIEWLRFVAANSLGFAINFAIYSLAVFLLPTTAYELLLALALGSLAGLFSNFLLTHNFVYQGGTKRDQTSNHVLSTHTPYMNESNKK